MKHWSRRRTLWFAMLTAMLSAAPTPGDVGGCGQKPDLLDPGLFFENKKRIDCQRCEECDVNSQLCREACDTKRVPQSQFPEDCYPLVHDGEVCLRALRYASCTDYEEYMSDNTPQTATECNFCPAEKQP